MTPSADKLVAIENLNGLTANAARQRLAMDGPNELAHKGQRSMLRIIGEVLREPMLVLLLIGGGAYLLLGDLPDALILLFFAGFSIVITVVQEARTEHVLEALRDLSAPRALVIRDGQQIRIAGREIVKDDLIVIGQGDRVAADAMLLEADDLQVDESLLTGESIAVRKIGQENTSQANTAQDNTEQLATQRPGGEDLPAIYSGSLVVRGTGLARVIATGAHTEIGKIGQSLSTLEPEQPRLKTETTKIVWLFGLIGALVALLVVILYGVLRGGWIEAVLAGITIGMSMLPAEFPVVLTVFMAMGAYRIGRVGVLTRRAAAIETLGSTTVLCTDKTGTLTENRMTVAEYWLPSGESAALTNGTLPPSAHILLDTAVLASAIKPVDPMEIAIQAAGKDCGPANRASWVQVHQYGLRPELLAMSNVWKIEDKLIIAAKGAPEAIAALCQLSTEALNQLTAATEAMAMRGIRVLGVASAVAPDKQWREGQSNYRYQLIGLIGLADPLRASVPAAVAQCQAAGIRVVMITGDYATTARSIAAQAGIAAGDVLTGHEMEALDDAQLAERLKTVTVFARIMPEQKLRIVQAFKADGEVVAMTGDGVNDAPSLKTAHIGIAMGKRGTDVAREASAIVLLEDDFGAIIKAVALGRRIYDNIRKAMAFIFAVHVPIAGLALLPLLFGLPILFGPIHIALIQMVIDPVCALVFEAEREEANIMKRKPRAPAESLFSREMIVWSVFQGLLGFTMIAAAFLIESKLGMPENKLRTMVFFALIAEIIALIFVNRSFSSVLSKTFLQGNNALRYVLATIVVITGLILTIPIVQRQLKFGSIAWQEMALALGLGILLFFILETCKPLAKRLMMNKPA